MPRDQLDYAATCQYVGQLFLETRHEIEVRGREVLELRRQLQAAEKERDDALALQLRPKPE